MLTEKSDLCLDVKGTWEALHVVGERTLVLEELDVGAIWLEVTLGALGNVLLTVERGEAPLLADDLVMLLEYETSNDFS